MSGDVVISLLLRNPVVFSGPPHVQVKMWVSPGTDSLSASALPIAAVQTGCLFHSPWVKLGHLVA